MRRFLVWFGRLVLIFVILGGIAGYFVANRYYNDEALAKRICQGFNKSRRGRLRIGSIHWRSRAILKLLKNGYDDVVVTDIRIYDSRGELALHGRVPDDEAGVVEDEAGLERVRIREHRERDEPGDERGAARNAGRGGAVGVGHAAKLQQAQRRSWSAA